MRNYKRKDESAKEQSCINSDASLSWNKWEVAGGYESADDDARLYFRFFKRRFLRLDGLIRNPIGAVTNKPPL